MRYEDASLSGSFQDQGPIARDDADQLAAGERGPATGNVITGAGTQSGAAGADVAAGAQIVAVSGAGGTDTSADGGRFRVEGEHGTLSLSPRGDYSYSAKAGVPENSRDVFTYTLSDAAGASSQARLLIEIGKTPAVVKADAQRVVPGPDGVVVLPAGVELSDVRVVGRDLLIMLPDGTQMLIVDGAVFVPQLVINDIEVPSTNLAALLVEQEPRPASGVPQSSGGNFIQAVGPLDPGIPLGDLLPPTQLQYVPPEFRDVGLEIDREPETGANALIQLDDDALAGGNPGGVGDDPDAVNVTGTLSGSGGDGPLTFAFTTAGAPAGFTYSVNANGALVVSQNGTAILTISLNAQTGAYSVVQNAPALHPAGENENNILFTFNYTVTDRDGDVATGTVQLSLDDDTPVIDVVAGADAGIILQTDDVDTRGDATDTATSEANFGGVFTLAVNRAGADGLGSAGAISYALGTTGGASGLTQGGASINLFLIGGKVVGSTAATSGAVTVANTVFDVSLVGANGVVRLTQYSQLDHSNTDPSPTGAPFNDQVVRLADGLVTLTATASITDRDGDTATDTAVIQIGDNIRFTDDGPSLTGAQAGAGVILDETDARSGFPITATSSGAVITGTGINYGADGQAAQSAATYAISIVGNGSTPLRTAVGDFPITLTQAPGNSNLITGTYDGGKVAFTVTINANGTLTVSQSVALEHEVDGSTPAAYDDSLSLAGLINATITLRDFDGDTAQASTGIGSLVMFKDDGPDSSLAVGAVRPTLILDETLPIGSDTAGAGAPGGLATVTASFASLFAAPVYGADGAGSVAYALVLNGQNVGSGLYALEVGDTSASDGDPIGRGQEILLNQSGDVITGTANGQAMFTIAINPATAEITFTQLQPMWNPVGGTSYDEAAVLTAAANALVLRQTVTDSDGDIDSSEVDLGSGVFQIQDDGPRAVPDTASLPSGSTEPVTGNVLANDSQGRDGATVFLLDAQDQPTTTLAGQYGVLTLNPNGDFSYVRNPGTPGGVSDVFTYALRDTDGDTATTTLTISIGNLTPTVNAPGVGTPGTVVNEAALGERGPGESQGSSEQIVSGPNGDTSEATSGTITFTQGDGPAEIRINGVLVTAVNQQIDTGEGILRIDSITAGSIGYTYTLKDNVLVSGPSSPDVIGVTVTDQDGDVASTNLVISIVNDRPDAIDDVDDIAAGSFAPATGNVITGIDRVGGDSNTTDGVADVQGADGAFVSAIASNNLSGGAVAVAANGDTIIQGQYGTLTISRDGSYSYVRAAGTPGGVSDVFTYTLRDNDGDQDTATLTIRIGNLPPTINAPDLGADGTIVYEAALGERGPGESQGSSEEQADGPNGDGREASSGTITFTQGDGPAEIRIEGVLVTGVNQQIDTGEGVLRIEAITAGSISYTYTLKDNVLVSGPASTDSISVSITDRDGQVASDTLVITIRNDAPDARDDVDLVGDALVPATGNVITGVDRPGGDANGTDGTRDIQGADGAFLSQIASNNLNSGAVAVAANGDTVIQGQYGTLTISADGNYSYLRFDGAPIDADDVFTYTLRDNDGDTDSATLTIQIRDTGVVVNIPGPGGASTTVFEAGLPARGDEPAGSGEIADGNPNNNSDPSEAVSGTVTFIAKDGVGSITLGSVTLNLAQPFTPQTIADDATGRLVVTSYSFNPATGQGSFGYTYTLKDNTSGDNSLASFPLVVTDSDGDQSGGNLVIAIRDDAPNAIDDVDSVGNSNLPATGNVITGIDRVGGDANTTDGNRDVEGADGAFVSAIASNNLSSGTVAVAANGDTVIQGQYGTLTISRDGSYSYTRTNGNPLTGDDRFTYMLRDNDGDTDTAVLTIQIRDNGVTSSIPGPGTAATTVFEASLPARSGEPAGSDEADPRELATGTITFSAPDGIGEIRLNNVLLSTSDTNKVVSDTATGTLTVIGFTFNNATQTWSLNYSYLLKDNTVGQQPPASGDTSETFAFLVKDSDGDQSGGDLVITIRDDAPLARFDLDSVSEGGTTDGNVLLGTGADPDNASGRDVQGADGTIVVGVQKGDTGAAFTGAVATEIEGSFGRLTLNADGSYTYKANADVVPTGQAVNDVFTYTIRDADGDLSFTTLTIKVNDVTLPADNQSGQVFEAALDTAITGDDIAAGTAIGSNPASPLETAKGDLNVVGATEYVLTGGTNNVIDSPLGKITLNPASGEWVYTLVRPASNVAPNTESVTETFNYVAKDAAGNSVPGTITITIVDDKPIANDDADRVTEGLGNTAEGNVLLGTGANPDTSAGRDVIGADNGGAVIGARTGAEAAGGNFASVASGPAGTLIQGTWGDLLIRADGSYTYTLKTASIPANVTSETFSYQMRDGDGDVDVAQLTINFDQDLRVPTVGNSTVTVFEDGLADGLQHGPNSEFTPVGTFTVDFNGETGGKAFIGATELVTGAQITTAKGVLTIGAITSSGSVTTYAYSYELKAAQTHAGAGESSPANDVLDVFTVTAIDPTGDVSNPGGTITIRIVDDIPVANDDAYQIVEGGPTSITFDVSLNDQNGADGFQSRDFATLVGTYGSITINPNGTQTYTLSPAGQAALIALGNGATLTDRFSYTLKDGDGDADPAEVVITLRGTDDPVTITNLTPTAQGGDAVVDEDDLPNGSDTTKESTTATGDFNISAPDGVATLKVGSFDLFVNGVFQVNSGGTTPLGNTLRFTSYDPITGKITYTYTLNAAENHAPVQGENSLFEELPVVLTDVDGSTASDILSIRIIDDVVDAIDEPVRTVVEGGPAISGNVITDSEGNGGADVTGADGATLIEINLGSGFVVLTSGTPLAGGFYQFVNAAGTYTFNANGAWTFAPASNLSNIDSPLQAGFVYKLRDGDGDTDTATQPISVTDGDGPGAGGNVVLTLNEAALDTSPAGDLAAGTVTGSNPSSPAETQIVTAANGLKFAAGSDAITSVAFGSLAGISVTGLQPGYTLSWSINGSGQLVGTLFEGATNLGTAILVQLTGETSGAPAGDIADIGVTATLVGPLEHAYPNAAQGPVSIGGIEVRASQADGDSNTGTIAINVIDDLPTAVIAIGAGEVRHDETPGVQADTDSATALNFAWVSNPGDDPDVPGTGAIGFAQSSFAVTATGSIYGADGAGSTTLSLLVNNAASGLKTTEGADIFLVQVGDRVEGRVGSTAAGSPVAFALQLNASRQIEVAQYLSLRHPVGGTSSPDEVVYLANGALSARVTVTDGDGDVSVATVSLDGKIGFEDDGPTAVAPQAASLLNNAIGLFTGFIDSNGIADNVGADGGTAQFSSNLALYPTGLTSNGVPITFAVSGNGQVLTASAGGLTVFTATISGNSYTIDIDRPVDSLTNVQFTDANYDFIGGNSAWFGIVPNNQVSSPVDDNSKDVLITPTSGSSVNTSGILGGIAQGQSVGPGEGFRLDYVVDLRGSPPNNYTQNAQNNHSFDQHWQTNGASVSFRQSTGTTLLFKARDDTNGNQIVGDGTQDTVNGIVITWNGAASTLLTPTTTQQSVTVGTAGNLRTFTYQLDSNGGVIIGNVGGATGNSGPPETTVSIFTADGYNSLEVIYVSGADIKFSGFGAAVPSTAPVNFNLPVVIVDGDGDVSPVGNIAVTLTSATAPIALDLDGDGQISYLGREAGVTFDYGGTGHKDSTAWVGSGDGILVRDANGNGLVDNASEFVFGDAVTTDLAALRARYGDVLDAEDADFGSFAVWQDANGNGVADAGEVKSLAELGITSIDLVSNGQQGVAANGEVVVAGSTSFVRGGATFLAQDAIFKTGSLEPVRGSDTGVATSAALVAAAAAAAALAAAPAAAEGGRPESGEEQAHDAPAAQGGSPRPEAVEAAVPAAGILADAPRADHAAPTGSHSEPVQHFGGAQQIGIDSGEPIGAASGAERLDQGTELAAHAPAFFAGGGEISLPAPSEMAALAALAKPGECVGPSAVAEVVSDALSGGGVTAADIDQLIDAAITIAGNGRGQGEAMSDGSHALADHLASPLSAAVPGWDGGDFGPLFTAHAAAMETHVLHPDAVQPVANG